MHFVDGTDEVIEGRGIEANGSCKSADIPFVFSDGGSGRF